MKIIVIIYLIIFRRIYFNVRRIRSLALATVVPHPINNLLIGLPCRKHVLRDLSMRVRGHEPKYENNEFRHRNEETNIIESNNNY